MIENIFIYMFLLIISIFPIILWAYVFSYIDSNKINKKRFLLWLIWGTVSVIPILYFSEIIKYINFEFLNIFYFITQINSFITSLDLILSLSLFLFIIIFISFICGFFIYKIRKIWRYYYINIISFFIFIIFFAFLIFGLGLILSLFDFNLEESIIFNDIVLNSFKLMVFYYLLIAFIEESSKHFNFLQSSILQIKSIKTWVLYAIFVALWFSMIENIIYLFKNYHEIWLSFSLVKTHLLRSFFSIMLHVLSSSIMAYYFSKAILLYKDKDLSFPYIKIFSIWVFFSILLHSIFDISLYMWFSFIIIIYFFMTYLYVSNIFYLEEDNTSFWQK